MSTHILQSLHSLLFPEPISSHFEVSRTKEFKEHIEIRLEELAELIPEELKGVLGKVVLDGFYNPIELQSFPLKGKAVYLKIYRRRWKVSGQKQHYGNRYNLHQEGVKATDEFASFLKAAFGQTPGQHNAHRNSLMR